MAAHTTQDTKDTSRALLRNRERMYRLPELSAREEHALIQNRAHDYAEGIESQSYSKQARRARMTSALGLAWYEEGEYFAECMQYQRVKINRGAIAFTINGELEELVVKIGQQAYEAESVVVRAKQTTIQDENGFITDVRINNRRTMNFKLTKHRDKLESEPRDREDSYNTIDQTNGRCSMQRIQKADNPQEAQQKHMIGSVGRGSTMATNNNASDKPTMSSASNRNSFECLDCDYNDPDQATSHTQTMGESVQLDRARLLMRLEQMISECNKDNNEPEHAEASSCKKRDKRSGERNIYMEQTAETHSPHVTTKPNRAKSENHAPMNNPYKQVTEMVNVSGGTRLKNDGLIAKLKEVKDKLKRHVAEINWHNRKMIKTFSTLNQHKLNEIIGTVSTKEVDLITTGRATWYKHKMSLTNDKWTELRWIMFAKKRCIIHEGSGCVRITTERSKREIRKHMEAMNHMGALNGMTPTVDREIITYQTDKQEFPHMQVQGGFWESIFQRYKMKSWGESMKLVHHYGVRLTEWSSIKARMRGSDGTANKHNPNGIQIDFEDSDQSDGETQPDKENESEEQGSKGEGESNSKKKSKKKKAAEKAKDWEQWNWKLGCINAADMTKNTSFKWNQLATIMDKNKLDGLAIQEHRLSDDSTFVAEKLGHLKLYLTPCTKGDQGGPAGGVAFLVRSELEEAGLITDHRALSAEGFYGKEDFAAELTLKHRSGTIKWISTYIRLRKGAEQSSYEYEKLEKLSTLKGNLLVMGDINGSKMYTEPREQWTKRGLGSQATKEESREAGNSLMEKIGHKIKRMWNTMQMTDISSKGEFKWQYTRDKENNKGVKVKNKLDVVAISSNLVKQCKARVVSIGDPQNLTAAISDHELIITRLKANNLIKAKFYEPLERYKTKKFLESKPHRLKMAVATNKSAGRVKQKRDGGASMQEISSYIRDELKEISEEIVGKETVPRRRNCRHMRYSNGEREALGKYIDANKEWALEWLKRRKDDSHFKVKQLAQLSRKAKTLYYIEIDNQKKEKRNKQLSQLKGKSSQEKSKMIHSMINQSSGSQRDDISAATEATMRFEGRQAKATTPEQIRALLPAYTYYVSRDSMNKSKTDSIDKKLKGQISSFSAPVEQEDNFCEKHREEIINRTKEIEREWEEGKTPIIHESLDKEFTWKEFKEALKTLSTKLTKAPGKDGIWNWMLFTSGEAMQREMLELFNKCWREEEMPEEWFQTLVSYIYKGKGNKNELTSYRPIGLSSALVNLFKKMWLNRIAPVLMKQMAPNQGGFRKGSGAREQLWTLVEFLEERMAHETGSIFCTTDAHKAFDQVFREGTTYLLYGHGIRGKMLKMLNKWINTNISTQLWRGHVGDEIKLDDNGIRQGCNLSPILYLIIINTLVSSEPGCEMPEWDKQFRKEAYSQGVQLIQKDMVGEWAVYLFVDDTAFLAEQTEDMNRILAAYNNFVNKWRIRINASKCKTLENDYIGKDTSGQDFIYRLGGAEINKVQKLKYLGVGLNSEGAKAHDKAKEAEATQGRFKLRTTRAKLGEGVAAEQLRSHITPSILYGMEMGKVTNKTLDGWHSWCLSEVMGIGRYTREDGYTGGEVNSACVWADYSQQTWSQTRAQNAKSLHRSIYSMEDSALPKKALMKGGLTNLLTTKYTPRVVKGDTTEGTWREKVKHTLSSLDTAKERNQWKREEKCSRITAALDRRAVIQQDLRNTVNRRSLLMGDARYLALGSGSAYGQSLQLTERSNTETLVHCGQADRRKIRAIKSGHIPHLKTSAQVKNGGWKDLSQTDKEKLVKCGCGVGGVQDMEHVLTDCGLTEDMVEEALTAVEAIRGETAQPLVKGRLTSAFREVGYMNDNERKVNKVMGKLHDDLSRALRAQLAVVPTYEAMPITHTHSPTVTA